MLVLTTFSHIGVHVGTCTDIDHILCLEMIRDYNKPFITLSQVPSCHANASLAVYSAT